MAALAIHKNSEADFSDTCRSLTAALLPQLRPPLRPPGLAPNEGILAQSFVAFTLDTFEFSLSQASLLN
jgi:hypothetical protein